MSSNKEDFHNIVMIGGGARCEVFLALLAKREDCQIAAIVENNRDNHQKLRERLDELDLKNTLLCNSLDDVIELSIFNKGEQSPYDMAFILTPEWTHADIFEKLIDTNFNIFLEKPLAPNEEEVLKIEKLALKTTRVVQVGFVLRYTPFYQKIKNVVTSGRLGELVMIEMSERLSPLCGASNRRRWHRLTKNSGGFLNEKSSHDLDIMCWLKETQGKPVRVFSHGGRNFFNRKGMPATCGECDETQCPYRFNGDINQNCYNARGKIAADTCVFNSDADIMDNQSVTIIFSDGTQGIFTLLNVSGMDGREIRIHGTEGSLYGNVDTNNITYHQYKGEKKEDLSVPASDTGHYGGDGRIIDAFFDCVKNGKHPNSTVEDGVKASLLAFEADKSVESKQVVRL